LKFNVNTKDFLKAIESSALKGKYYSSTGLKNWQLSPYAFIVVGEDISIYNGDDATALGIQIPAEIETEGQAILEINKLVKYLKKMGENVTVAIGDVARITSAGKIVTLPVNITHPAAASIQLFRDSVGSLNLEGEDFTFGRTNTEYKTVLNVSADLLSDALSACEIVNHGVYKFDYNGTLTISSNKDIENYAEEVEVVAEKDEPATVEITAPIHKLFKKEIVKVCFNDNTPILIVGATAKIFRAPYVNV